MATKAKEYQEELSAIIVSISSYQPSASKLISIHSLECHLSLIMA
jgi:hypothetical protein